MAQVGDKWTATEIYRLRGNTVANHRGTPILSGGRIFARSTKEAVCLDVSGK